MFSRFRLLLDPETTTEGGESKATDAAKPDLNKVVDGLLAKHGGANGAILRNCQGKP